MSFLLLCPVCGPRDVYEFRYGGEILRRPLPDAGGEAWSAYRYLRTNAAGPAQEWWFHRAGCRRWFQAERDTVSNVVMASWWPGSRPSPAAAAASTASTAQASTASTAAAGKGRVAATATGEAGGPDGG